MSTTRPASRIRFSRRHALHARLLSSLTSCRTHAVTRWLCAMCLCSAPLLVVAQDATHPPHDTSHTVRPVLDGATMVFPYGRTQPTVMCSRLRACVFQLAPGEVIADKLLIGDPERWTFDVTTSGVGGGTQLLSIKPTDCDLTTNLTVPTDRHIYFLTLDAPPCPGQETATNVAQALYTRVFRFSYPEEQTVALMPRAPTTGPIGVPPERLNFNYTWTADKHFPWRPEHVFDDGVHLYIKIPAAARASVAPVLFAVGDDNTTVILNYTVTNDLYVTDRLAPRVALVIGDGKKPQRVVIERRSTP